MIAGRISAPPQSKSLQHPGAPMGRPFCFQQLRHRKAQSQTRIIGKVVPRD